ncbi:MAG: TMEM14 family protein [Opitutales bacterium]
MNTKQLGQWFLGFGAFLIVCGLLGYLSNPETAKTALISGGSFGLLSMVWGLWLLRTGAKAAWFAATGTTLLLLGAFSWRATASWQDFLAGEPKFVAAVLITAMWFGSLTTLLMLWRGRACKRPA